ncbi:MAG: peptidase family protein [Nocardioidaceae bacterium]|nr:peptidase family protein [Nocardioidaceae bacterium]
MLLLYTEVTNGVYPSAVHHSRSALRRTALAVGLALLPLALVPAVPATAAGDARATYTSFTGAQLTAGRAVGASAASGRVAITAPYSRTVAGARWETARWTSPWVTPGHAFSQLIPSWRATTPGGSWITVTVRATTSTGAVTSFDTIANWARKDTAFRRTSGAAQPDDLGRVATDTFVANSGVAFTAWQVRVVLHRKAGTAGPKVAAVGAVASQRASAASATSTPLYGAQALAVPAFSQMTHRGEYPKYGGGGEAWCSPTSTAMVLGYYSRLPAPASYAWVKKTDTDRYVDGVARATYDRAYRGTGNWGFNTALAASRTGDAFVTRLADLRDAERFVRAGIPLVASIAFPRGHLTGAPISASNGHLVVITGFTASGNVLVNDPAGASNAVVARTYDRGQFERAWLDSSGGTVYVIHDAAHPLPARDGSTAW